MRLDDLIEWLFIAWISLGIVWVYSIFMAYFFPSAIPVFAVLTVVVWSLFLILVVLAFIDSRR